MVGNRAFAEPRPHTIRLKVQTGITNFKLKAGCNSGRQVFRSWRTKNLRILPPSSNNPVGGWRSLKTRQKKTTENCISAPLRNRGRKRIGLTNRTEIKTVIRNLTLT